MHIGKKELQLCLLHAVPLAMQNVQFSDVMESHTQATWEEEKWPQYEVSHIADKHVHKLLF